MGIENDYPVPPYWSDVEDAEAYFVRLKAIGNVFRDNYCCPFAVIWPEDVEKHVEYAQNCRMEGNRMCGYNQSNKYQGVLDSTLANRLRNIEWDVKAAESE